MPYRRQDGFSLVELAIVLAIIGMLAGGIIAGQSMIQRSKLNAVLMDANKFADAKQQFKDKYEYLPGDFPRAVQVWGKADGDTNLNTNCAAPLTNASPDGVRTCNGNGNGFIDSVNGDHFWMWQHLSAAGYIQGRYTGIAGSADVSQTLPGTNAPAGALDNTGYFTWTWGIYTADDPAYFYAGDYYSAMTFGTKTATAWPSDGALTAPEAESLDRKGDDGVPGRGSIRALYPNRSQCTTTTSSATAAYAKTWSTKMCTLAFLNSYRAKNQL